MTPSPDRRAGWFVAVDPYCRGRTLKAMHKWSETPVVTCFIRHHSEVLLLRRSAKVGSYAGEWGTVAGHADGNPDAAARREIREEVGLTEGVTLVRRGEAFPVDDAELETRWVVHPYLFDAAHRSITLNGESVEAEWVMPTEILRRDTVPQLWTSYEHVAPTVESVAADTEHGSAYIAARAAEVLRDVAGQLRGRGAPDGSGRLRETARQLFDARPSMAALGNRIHRIMNAAAPAFAPATIESEAHHVIQEAHAAQMATVRQAAEQIAGQHILTLSRSSTVLDAMRHADPSPSVIVAESRPDCEGVYTAEALADHGAAATLCTDAAIPAVIDQEPIDAVIVGADTVLASGDVVNKTGTRSAALAAQEAGIPVLVVASTDKISPDTAPHREEGPPAAVYGGTADIRVLNPTFDVTPAAWVAGWITEQGTCSRDEVGRWAATHGGWRAWMRASPDNTSS